MSKKLIPLTKNESEEYEPLIKPLSIPEGSDFLWRAKDYDASTNSIRNLVENSYFGTLNIMNTPTFVDGEKKYLNFTNLNQYLYHSLDSNAQANLLGNGDNHYYTIIFKASLTSNVTGILLNLTKTKTSYFNMLWANRANGGNGNLEVSIGNNTGVISNISTIDNYYFRYERTNSQVTLTCLDTNVSQTLNLSGTQYIDNEIRFMSHGSNQYWRPWDRFYGVYGIPRQLTDKETQDVIRLLDSEDPHDDRPIHYQSRTEVEDPTPKYWDGTYDTSWKTKDSDGVCHISTPEQFADFLRNNNESSKSGISQVVLDNDIYMNEDYENALNWSNTSSERKLTKSSRGNFTPNSLNFNGNGYTIYGLSISLGTANWNTIFYINQNGITFSFNNTRFYGFYLQTNNSMGTFNPLAYSDTAPTIEFKEISFVKLNLKHLSSSVQAGRPKAFTGVQNDKYNIKTYFDFSFDECDFSGCEFIISRDWWSTSDSFIPTKNNTTKVSIKNSKLPTKRVLDEGMYLLNVGANAYNNITQEGTPESGHTNTNTIMNDTLKSYVLTHNEFSDYDFDSNGDYEDLQPLEPFDPSKYEKVEITKIPEGSDFLWVARDYDSSTKTTKNRVNDSSFGLLNTYNTPTIQNDSDGKKYLNFTNVNQYLYHALDSNAQTNLLGNGDNHCYTIIFKFLITNVTPSVIIMNLTKTKTSYCNMLWKTPKYRTLEIYSGNDNTTKSNIDIVNHFYLKYERTNSNVTLTCLDTNLSQTLSLSGTQYIDNEIRFMSAGHTWSYCDRFYGVYGIPRKLTNEETQDVVKILNDEKEYKWYKIGDPKLLLINPKNVRK